MPGSCSPGDDKQRRCRPIWKTRIREVHSECMANKQLSHTRLIVAALMDHPGIALRTNKHAKNTLTFLRERSRPTRGKAQRELVLHRKPQPGNAHSCYIGASYDQEGSWNHYSPPLREGDFGFSDC